MAPLPRVLVAFIVGILLACCYPRFFGQQYALIVSCAVLALSYLPLPVLMRRKRSVTSFGVCTMLFALVLGFVRAGFSHQTMCRPIGESNHSVTATVLDYAVEKKKSYATTIDCGKSGGRQMVYLWSSSGRPMKLEPGDRIQFVPRYRRSVISEIEKLESKGEEERQLLGYQRHLYYSHISATQYARRWWTTKNNAHERFNWGKLRKRVAEQYASLQLPSEEEAILTAMTLGDRRAMREKGMNISKRYSRAGVSHVLALSGFHLTIIYALLDIFFLSSFFRRKHKWLPHLLVIISLWAYTLLAGTPPSLVRAAAMCTIICVAKTLYGGKQSGFDALTLSAFIMLLFDPFYIMNISFQLSYASMLGITIASPALSGLQAIINKSAMLSIAKKLTSYFVGIILISVIATLSTAGIVAYHFASISLVGIATNICVSVLASVLMMVAVVWWILRLVWGIGSIGQTAFAASIDSWLAGIIHGLLKCMNQSVDFFSSFSHATLQWSPTLFEVILYYGLLCIAVWLLMRRHILKLRK